MVGFESSRVTFQNNGKSKQVQFKLKPSTVLNEVLVTSKRNAFWRRKWRIFEEGLLGAPARRVDCTILNPGVVQLDYDEKTLKVKAYTTEPLEVINEHLGYRISVQINYFESDGKSTSLAADKYFDSLQVNSLKHWQRILRARQKTYANSFRSFLVSLAHGTTEEVGFEVFQTEEIRNTYLSPVYLNDTSNHFYNWIDPKVLLAWGSDSSSIELNSDKPLLVIIKSLRSNKSPHADYPFAYSQIDIPNGSFTFDTNGWLLKPNGLFLYNQWGTEGLAALLPDNYDAFRRDDFLLKMDVPEMQPMNKRARNLQRLPEKISLPQKPQPATP